MQFWLGFVVVVIHAKIVALNFGDALWRVTPNFQALLHHFDCLFEQILEGFVAVRHDLLVAEPEGAALVTMAAHL